MKYKKLVRIVAVLFIASMWFSKPIMAAEDFAEVESIEEITTDESIISSGSSVESEFYNRFRSGLIHLGRIQLNDELSGKLTVIVRTLANQRSEKVFVSYTLEKYRASTRTWHYYDSQAFVTYNDNSVIMSALYKNCPKGQYRLKAVHTVENGGQTETKTTSTEILDTEDPF